MRHRIPPRSRLPFALIATVLATALGLVVGSGVAHAAAYRFWGFYQWKNDTWVLAPTGPASVTPADGAVEGWRFAVSGEDTPPRVPRAAGDFDLICGSTPEQPGMKRVALVIDYGIPGEGGDTEPPASRGACAVVDTDASSAQVLAAVAEVREQNGLICAIDKYPGSGCGDPVDSAPEVPSPEPTVALVLPDDSGSDASPSPDRTDAARPASDPNRAAEPADEDGFPIVPVAGVVIVAALAVGGFLISRRQRGTGSA
ncbi:MAG TPA: SCO2322 family protein [Actinopolymorphaceae bacterium]|jgi:hypothetical protein